jgi:hypothetical protein
MAGRSDATRNARAPMQARIHSEGLKRCLPAAASRGDARYLGSAARPPGDYTRERTNTVNRNRFAEA